ncbi:MAG TPA: hypothetical protein VGG25_24380 [Streptosporangiaceae bacterium]
MAQRHPSPAASSFLSGPWINDARKIRDEYLGLAGIGGADASLIVRLNVTVTGLPGQERSLHGHIECSETMVDVEEGHLAAPHATLVMAYGTAQDLLLGGDIVQDGLAAMVDGRMTVQGPMSKVVALGGFLSTYGAPMVVDVSARLREITTAEAASD